MALVYSYVRFSSRRQSKGDSLRRQLENGQEWIAENGHTSASLTLQDLGVSAFRGANKHKGALRTFLDAIEAGKVQKGSILLVEHLDRLSRQGIHDAIPLFLQILNAGVDIAVLKPQPHVYNKPSEPNEALIGLLLPLVYFHLAHIESLTKSDRLRDLWDKKRKEASYQTPFDRRCPSWISWDEETNGFVLNEGAAAIRYIFEKSADGLGQHKILGGLQENFEPIGTSGRWNTSFLQKVLNDRAVLGERQPKQFDENGERIPVGDPIPNYYPAAVDESLWFKSQSSKNQRRKQKGPTGTFVNLFTGVIFNAVDGTAMHIQTSPHVNGGRQRRLVSYGHKSKAKGACPLSVEYHQLENGILQFLTELDPNELLPQHGGSQNILAEKQQELDGIVVQLKEIEDALNVPGHARVGAAVRAAMALESKQKLVEADIEAIKQDLHSDSSLVQTQGLLELLRNTTRENEHDLRIKLRSNLAGLLESIFVKPEKYKGRVYAIIQLNFRDGGFKHLWLTPNGTTMLLLNANGPFGIAWSGLNFPNQRLKRKEIEHYPSESLLPQWDLRTPEGSEWSMTAALAEQDETIDIPATIPDELSGAAEVWLQVAKAKMSKQSFRVVPSKIERFVERVGPDTLTSELSLATWRKWKRWLKSQVSKGKLAKQTARVNYNRAKEFVTWLTEQGKTPSIAGLESAAKAIP